MQDDFPEPFLGELRFKDFEDLHASKLRAMSTQRDPGCVTSLRLSRCKLGSLSAQGFKNLVESVNRFTHLCILDVSGCGLCGDQLGKILLSLCKHDLFLKRGALARSTRKAELHIGNNPVHDASFLQGLGNCKLMGVSTLNIMETNISDDDLPVIACRFPNLERLFLSGTRVECRDLSNIVASMVHLHTLGLDSTPCGDVGVDQVRASMSIAAAAIPSRPLEVWLRDVQPPTSKWYELLRFVAQNQRDNVYSLVLKHDMQNSIGQFPRHAIASYENVVVVVHIYNHSSVRINYGKTLCSRSVASIAEDAINELNLFLMCDEREVRDRLVMARKLAFREAFEKAVSIRGGFPSRRYVIGCFQITKTDRYSGEVQADYYPARKLLGRENTRCDYVIEVEAEGRL